MVQSGMDAQSPLRQLADAASRQRPIPAIDRSAIESRASLARIMQLMGEAPPPAAEPPAERLVSVSELADTVGLTRHQIHHTLRTYGLPHTVLRSGRYGRKATLMPASAAAAVVELRVVRHANGGALRQP
jgi:hypothetical protein